MCALNDSEKILISHVIDNELMRLEKIRSDSESVKVFDEIYKEHMDAIRDIKSKLFQMKSMIHWVGGCYGIK